MRNLNITFSSVVVFTIASFLICGNSQAESNEHLRSAYLGTSAWANELPSAEINQQLQSHFTEVIWRLEEKQGENLLLALRHAESTSSRNWTHSQRAAVLLYLAVQRQQQIDRLRFYRDRGLFPVNEGQSTSAGNGSVPIFVDRNETHCAVGYLMHANGDDSGVQAIRAANNLVYVNDAHQGSLLNWIRTSGLTQQEAAMIQPSYPVPLDATFEDLSVKGATIETGAFEPGNYILSEASLIGFRFFADDLPASFVDNPEAIEAIFNQGRALLEDNDIVTDALRRDTGIEVTGARIYIGSSDAVFGGFIGSATGASTGIVAIEFTLSPQPGSRLNFLNFTLASMNEAKNGPSNTVSGEQSAILLSTEVFDGSTGDLLGSVDLFATGEGLGQSSGNLTPLLDSDTIPINSDATVSLRVRTYGMVVGGNANANDTTLHSFTNSFQFQSIVLGDVNQDAMVDLLDVEPFVDRIIAGQFQPEADVNSDGVVDLLDIAAFVALLVD